MSPTSIPPGQRRRLGVRALPLLALAAAAFAAGALIGDEGADVSAAERFAAAWEDGDFAAMHEELSDESARRFPLEEFTRRYQEAATTASLLDVDAGEADDGGDGALVPVTARTHAFGEVSGRLEIPLDSGEVEWTPNLVFPGLAAAERLASRREIGERAPIVALDGTRLASGPATARAHPAGTEPIDAIGEVGAPDAELAARQARLGYPPGVPPGVSGLEAAFDERLAGTPGGDLLAVPRGPASPGTGRVLASRPPTPGEALRTTISPAIQRAAVAALGGQLGGVAVLDARTGDVRALAGLAFSAPQPPGSTFKVITAAAALEAGVVSTSDEFPVETSAVVGGREIANAHDEPCGGTFVQAFARSCNSVFAPLGAELGSERLVEAAERFGFNEPPALYNQAATERIEPPRSTIPPALESELEAGVSAIGQGRVLATPLVMASVSQAIANGGMREPTAIVRGADVEPAAEPVRATPPEVATTVRNLMVQVVAGGTGTAAAIPGITVAGKTGTAELGTKRPLPEDAEPDAEAEQEVDAWFTAFAPAGDPKLAIAVMLVNAEGDGGEVAAPIAREILAAALSAGAL